jgi:hypothetical protein
MPDVKSVTRSIVPSNFFIFFHNRLPLERGDLPLLSPLALGSSPASDMVVREGKWP